MGLFNKFTKKKEYKPDLKTGAVKVEEKKVVKKTESTKTKTEKKITKKDSIAYRILIKPLVTEKTTIMQTENKYAFIVEKGATKIQIKKAIKELYGINPLTVRSMNMQGKRVSRGRVRGMRKDFKKAIVKLPKGKSITIHDKV